MPRSLRQRLLKKALEIDPEDRHRSNEEKNIAESMREEHSRVNDYAKYSQKITTKFDSKMSEAAFQLQKLRKEFM